MPTPPFWTCLFSLMPIFPLWIPFTDSFSVPYLAMSRHVLALFLAVAYFSLRDSLYTGSISNQNLSWKLEKKHSHNLVQLCLP